MLLRLWVVHGIQPPIFNPIADFLLFIFQWCRKVKKFRVPVVISGNNLPSPCWNRVNWSGPPVPESLYFLSNKCFFVYEEFIRGGIPNYVVDSVCYSSARKNDYCRTWILLNIGPVQIQHKIWKSERRWFKSERA